MKKRIAVVTLGVGLFISGCASIMHGTTQSVGISSTPSGASVTVDGQIMGTTPVFADLSRKEEHIVSIALPGYETQDLTLTRSVSGWVWGNIVFGGLIGLGVDAVSGGLYKLTPEQLNASMGDAKTAQGAASNDTLHVQIVLEPHQGWEKIGALESDSTDSPDITGLM